MTALGVVLVLMPTAWLGFVHRLDYETWFLPTFSRMSGLVLLAAYATTVGVMGIDVIDERVIGLEWGAFEYRAFAAFTLLPGISFGIIVFPETAAAYSQHYFRLLSANQLSSFAFIGWVLLTISALWMIFWYVAA